MKYNNILHITDDCLYLKSKKQKDIIKYKLSKNIVYGGRISNIKKFMKSFEKLLSENHLNNSLFGETIKVVVASNYTPADITFLKNIINSFNYRKIIIEKELKYYKLNNNIAYVIAYVNVFDNYFNITYLDEYKKINNIYMETQCFLKIDDILEYFSYILNQKEVYLLGSGELIKEIFSKLEDKFNIKTYIFSNYETYIITGVKD